MPILNTAVGKAVLAFLDPGEIPAIIGKLKLAGEFDGTEEDVTKSLADVRRDGFASTDREMSRGILALAVPVFSPQGVECAINMVAEPEDVTIETFRAEYAPKLMAVGRELSKALGYRE